MKYPKFVNKRTWALAVYHLQNNGVPMLLALIIIYNIYTLNLNILKIIMYKHNKKKDLLILPEKK